MIQFLKSLFKKKINLEKELNLLKERQIIDFWDLYHLNTKNLKLFQIKINDEFLLLESFKKDFFLIDFFHQESWHIETKEQLENICLFYRNSETKKEES